MSATKGQMLDLCQAIHEHGEMIAAGELVSKRGVDHVQHFRDHLNCLKRIIESLRFREGI